jgi:hypothetical protein
MKGVIKITGLLSFIIFTSCAKKDVTEQEKLEKKKDVELIEALSSLSSLEFDTFYTKVSTKYSDSSSSQSFKTTVRIKHDSLVNARVTFANIPIINSIISNDSVQITNKRDKCYLMESLTYIKKSFGVEFTHRNIEELFLGQAIGFDPEKKYYQTDDPYSYTLCSHRKKDIRKNERKDLREIVMYYTLSDDLSSLERIQIESPGDTTSIVINYLERETINEISVPVKTEVQIFTPRQEIVVSMHYKKTRMNEAETIHFVIPEDYEKCK